MVRDIVFVEHAIQKECWNNIKSLIIFGGGAGPVRVAEAVARLEIF
jgi:hypothetical protein